MEVKIPIGKRERGLFAVVDDGNEHLLKYRWQALRRPNGHGFYATRNSGKIYLHREIMQAPAGMEIDHIDGDGLNCRLVNLRIATHQQNCSNVRLPSHNTSGYKGVRRVEGPAGVGWKAFIKVNQKQKSLGVYATAEDAARAYDIAARREFGEFARPNLPDVTRDPVRANLRATANAMFVELRRARRWSTKKKSSAPIEAWR